MRSSDFLDFVMSEIDCSSLLNLMQNIENNQQFSNGLSCPRWPQVPDSMKKHFLEERRFNFEELFLDNRVMDRLTRPDVFAWTHRPLVFSERVQNIIKEKLSKGHSTYNESPNLISQAADYMDIRDKNVLVIGTEVPWMETLLLERRPRRGVTVEYAEIKSEIPGWEFWTPSVFRKKYLSGTLEKFDFVFTYSSVEHSGLGRYGDPLNPWGDIMAVAEAWCVTTDQAKLAIGVPTSLEERGTLVFNLHRIYGKHNYPYLVSNWQYEWQSDNYNVTTDYKPLLGGYQPLYVFKKVNSSNK